MDVSLKAPAIASSPPHFHTKISRPMKTGAVPQLELCECEKCTVWIRKAFVQGHCQAFQGCIPQRVKLCREAAATTRRQLVVVRPASTQVFPCSVVFQDGACRCSVWLTCADARCKMACFVALKTLHVVSFVSTPAVFRMLHLAAMAAATAAFLADPFLIQPLLLPPPE